MAWPINMVRFLGTRFRETEGDREERGNKCSEAFLRANNSIIVL
jgi:hypothetical protein